MALTPRPEDRVNDVHQLVFGFYERHPNTSWTDAADALGLDDATVVNASVWLELRHYLTGACDACGQTFRRFAPMGH